MTVGFIGLGRMGEPMATRLARSGAELVVWSRREESVRGAVDAGATAAASAEEVFHRCDIVLLMLSGPDAIDGVLQRDAQGFGVPVGGRLVVNLGTVAPEYSRDLGLQLRGAGARFAESPVSGSRVPAQNGTLVAMAAGDPDDLATIAPLLGAFAASVFPCGEVPRALETKLAVNVFLLATVTGLAESLAFAEERGIDTTIVRAVLDAGPMASAISTLKLAKLADGDFDPQAAVRDVLYNNRLILDAAPDPQRVPIMTATERLYAKADAAGLGDRDMIAVIEALRG